MRLYERNSRVSPFPVLSLYGRKGFYVEGWDPGVACLSGIWPGEDLTITILGNTNCSVWSLYGAVR
jgi:hypothetical protein